nr:proline-rich receptor-like protein kinase PERK8 isoform X1 [Macaca nemestrina]
MNFAGVGGVGEKGKKSGEIRGETRKSKPLRQQPGNTRQELADTPAPAVRSPSLPTPTAAEPPSQTPPKANRSPEGARPPFTILRHPSNPIEHHLDSTDRKGKSLLPENYARSNFLFPHF